MIKWSDKPDPGRDCGATNRIGVRTPESVWHDVDGTPAPDGPQMRLVGLTADRDHAETVSEDLFVSFPAGNPQQYPQPRLQLRGSSETRPLD
jgi:hypothetical protein